MEINANPSFNMFLERDLQNGGGTEKTLSELDKYLKSKVASESIHIMTGGEYDGGEAPNRTEEDRALFTQVLPCDEMEGLYIWNEV